MLPRLVAQGTFMDGLWYDTIARNQAIGLGSFWRPMFTPTVSPGFFADHPPLVFAIESTFFRLFGDHWWVGKLYGFATAVASMALILGLWRDGERALGRARVERGWLPILLWAATPLVTWSFSNEMLENTMGLFVLLAAWAFFRAALAANGVAWAALAGAVLFCGMLCKGVVALFPLAFPIALALAWRRTSLRRGALHTLVALVLLGGLAWLTLRVPEARAYYERYVANNFLPLLSGQRGGVTSRLHIVGRLGLELLPMLVLAVLVAWLGRSARPDRARGGLGAAFVLLGLAGSLPLALSPIQSGFYLVPSLAFFAIGFGLLAGSHALEERLTPYARATTAVAGMLLLGALAFAATRAGTIGRGGSTIPDLRTIGKTVPPGSTVGICRGSHRSWSLHGYAMLYDRVTLDAGPTPHEFFLVEQGACLPPGEFAPVALPTDRLLLYRRSPERR